MTPADKEIIEKVLKDVHSDYYIHKGTLIKLIQKALTLSNENVLKVIDEFNWDRNKDKTSEQIANSMINANSFGGVNGIIDRHNKSLEELKQKLSNGNN
jgi:hypothetical protein